MSEYNLLAITSENGDVLIADKKDLSSPCKFKSSLNSLMINGKLPEMTFNLKWVKISGIPYSVKKLVPAKKIAKKFILKNPELATEKIPLELPYERVTGGNYKVGHEHMEYAYLYEMEFELGEPGTEDVSFSVEVVAEVKQITNPLNMNYSTYLHSPIKSEHLIYSTLDSIMIPEVILHTRPCKLSSKHTYNILLTYIKKHLDLCSFKINNNFSNEFCVYSRPKSNADKPVLCFKMTHDENRASGFPVIKGISGADQSELVGNLEKYCKKLLNKIENNQHKCKKCHGRGFVVDLVKP